MNVRVRCLAFTSLVACLAAACGGNTPTQPSASATAAVSSGDVVSAASLTGSVTIPRPVQPGNGVQIRNGDQPVTLAVLNAVVTKAGDTTYTFEVATDAAFSSKVQTKDGVAEGSGGQTSVKLDTLAASTDYYWHARARSAGTTGLFSATYKFTIGPAIAINPPVPIGPLSGTQTSPRPTLRVMNATRQGPAGAITYKFEIARDSAFTTVVVTGTNTEGVNETGLLLTSDLPTGISLFWRATAIDAANGITSSPSAVQSFTAVPFSQAEAVAAQLGLVLWPRSVPPGSVGHATMGNDPNFGQGWHVQTLYYAPGNVTFQSPDAEMLRLFDLLDRGFDPDGAAGWMNTNGYPTAALWYPPPEKAVIGLQYVYLAARGKNSVNGTWDVVLRVE